MFTIKTKCYKYVAEIILNADLEIIDKITIKNHRRLVE